MLTRGFPARVPQSLSLIRALGLVVLYVFMLLSPSNPTIGYCFRLSRLNYTPSFHL